MTTDAVGGVFSYTVELAGALAGDGVEVAVAVLGPPPDSAQRAQLHAAGAAEVHAIEGRLEWMPDPLDDLERAARTLLELARELKPDVVHAGSFFCGALPFEMPVVVVAHSCVYSWWNAVRGTDPPADWERYRRLVSDGLAGADAVVAPTAAMLDALRRHYRRLPERSLVIPNGIHIGEGTGRKQESFVLAAGRMWDQAKNLEALTAAAPALPGPVLVAGELGDRAEPSLSEDDGNLHLLGRMSPAALGRLRRRAPVFAAPARYEPFGLAVLEAAADRCALVLGDIPSLRETWDGCAVFVDPDDHTGLASALRCLLEQPERAAELGARARARAEELSSATTAAAYFQLYGTLARTKEVQTV